MNKISLLFLLSALSTTTVQAQFTVMPGTKVKVVDGTNVGASSNVVVEEGSDLEVDGLLKLTGSGLTVNGNLSVDGALAMNGSSSQQVNGSKPFSARVIRINNPDGVAVQSDIQITDSLQMQHGVLTVDTTTPIHFALTSTSPAESSDSYITGRAVMDARQTGAGAVPAFLGCAITGGADIGKVTITRTTGPEGIITEGDHQSIAANWLVQTSKNPDAANRHITFYWLPEQDNGKDIRKIDLYSADLGSYNYEKLNGASATLPNLGIRMFTQHRVERFNSVFTLSDDKNPLHEPPVGQRIRGTFPNPFLDKLTILVENTRDYPVVIRMVDATGKQVYQSTQMPANDQVSISGLGYLPQGSYWLQLHIHGSSVSTHVIKIQ